MKSHWVHHSHVIIQPGDRAVCGLTLDAEQAANAVNSAVGFATDDDTCLDCSLEWDKRRMRAADRMRAAFLSRLGMG